MRFSSFAFVSSFGALFVASVAVGACSATQTTIPLDFGDAGTSTNPTIPGSSGSSGTSGSSGKPAGTTCEKICEKAAAAKCASQSTCVTDCEADQSKIPAACKAEADAVQECAATKASKFECNSKGKPVVKGDCDTEGQALVQCVLNGPKPDAGPKDCGTLQTGDATCDTCMEAKCCSQLAACSGDKACTDLLDCYGGCNDNACYTKCDTDHPGGVTKSKALFSCMSGSCSAQCN